MIQDDTSRKPVKIGFQQLYDNQKSLSEEITENHKEVLDELRCIREENDEQELKIQNNSSAVKYLLIIITAIAIFVGGLVLNSGVI